METLDALDMTFTQADRVVAGVRPDQLHGATPCDEWDVRTLLGHMLGVVVNCGRGAGGGELLRQATVELDDDLGAQFRAEADRTFAAWRGCDLDGSVDIGAGPMPAAAALGVNVVDTTTHAWDLAQATGQDFTLSDDHAAVVLDLAHMIVKEQRREVVGFAPPVHVGPHADTTDRLVAFLGRTP